LLVVQVENQLVALQDEVDSMQLQTMQSALDVLERKLQQLQQQQAEQAALLDSQKVSTAASLALLAPREPRVDHVSGGLGSLATQVSALQDLVAQQPARFDQLNADIEQLSQRLTEVNAASAGDSDVQVIMQQLESLQDQLYQLRASLAADVQAATDAAAAAAAMASTAAEAAAGVAASTQQQLAAQREQHEQWQQQAAEGILQCLTAVEGSVQQPSEQQGSLSMLQQKVDQHIDDAREQAAKAAAAFEEQQSILNSVGASTSVLAGKLEALELSVNSRVGDLAADVSAAAQKAADSATTLEANLQQQGQELQAAFTVAQESLLEALKEQQAKSSEFVTAVTSDLSDQVQALEASIEVKVAAVQAAMAATAQQVTEHAATVNTKLQQHDSDLRTAFKEAQEAHDADLKQQLKEQVDTMAQILADVGTYRSEQSQAIQELWQQLQGVNEAQEHTQADHGTQLERLTGELSLTVTPSCLHGCAHDRAEFAPTRAEQYPILLPASIASGSCLMCACNKSTQVSPMT
jgi:chromosome segregation ATPase